MNTAMTGGAMTQVSDDPHLKIYNSLDSETKAGFYFAWNDYREVTPKSLYSRIVRAGTRRNYGVADNWANYINASLAALKSVAPSDMYKNIELHGVVLVRIDFTELDLSETLFKDCQFHRCNFTRCDMTNAIFEDCDFFATELAGCNMQYAIAQRCKFTRCEIRKSDMRYMGFENTIERETRFTNGSAPEGWQDVATAER
jgi:hypothetical protein